MADGELSEQRQKAKRARFKRLAETRGRKVLDALRVLSHCSNTSLYNYNQDEIKEIFQAIEKETKRVKAKFEKPQNIKLKFK
jgi:hypothetical protein